MIPMLTAWTAFAFTAMGGVASTAANGTVTGLQILPSDQRTEVVIAVDGSVEVREFSMEGPYRLVVDILGARYELDRESFGEVSRGGIRTVRASQYSEDVVRVVLELDGPLGYTLLTGSGYVRLSLENQMGDFEPWRAEAGRRSPAPAAQAVADPFTRTSAAPAGRDGGPRAGASGRSSRWSGLSSDEFARRITVTFTDTPIRDVLFTFAEFSDRSIVPGTQVAGNVNAEIREQPWDIALQAILESHDLAAQEQLSGIIRVDRLEDLNRREEVEHMVTRSFRVNYANARELEPPLQSLLSERGRLSVSASTNSLVVTDVPRVLESVEELIAGLDLQTPEITISAKIIFVNRTELQEFGVIYDLKDSRGNQLNVIAPGFLEGEQVDIGTNVVALGGNSVAALGNAHQRLTGPSLQFLTSLLMGRHTLISFVEALAEVQLSDIQAAPQTRVLDNQQAKILVGERTPIRVIDAAGAGAGVGQQVGQFPQATVQIEETGILLEVTPHVTAGDLILMELRAERSGIELAPSDLGFTFNTQEVITRVLVEDGETVVVGGLTVTERSEVRAGIPLLQELPLLGRFFRVTRERKDQRDLMILVTPQINRR
jgi:type IV pilus assembly protein PilQ